MIPIYGVPAIPKVGFEVIDVRSVADALIKVMEIPSVANKRYLLSSGFLMMKDMARYYRSRSEAKGEYQQAGNELNRQPTSSEVAV